MSFVRNQSEISAQLDLWMRKAENMSSAQFQEFCWEVFKRILRESPQYSGKGVANWNLSLKDPDYTIHETEGDAEGTNVVQMANGRYRAVSVPVHQRGDERWMRSARARARPVKEAIHYRSKVFIANGSLGNDEKGNPQRYMVDLQDGAYWEQHLRAVNQPYETAKESILAVAMEFMNRRNNPSFPARIGGDDW